MHLNGSNPSSFLGKHPIELVECKNQMMKKSSKNNTMLVNFDAASALIRINCRTFTMIICFIISRGLNKKSIKRSVQISTRGNCWLAASNMLSMFSTICSIFEYQPDMRKVSSKSGMTQLILGNWNDEIGLSKHWLKLKGVPLRAVAN